MKKDKIGERNKNKKASKVIELNAGFTILKIIAIILIILLITVQTVRTIIQARTSTSESETEAETTEEEATYYLVDSTEIDEETGEYIQVPVPVGYTASQIEGETGVSTGFVIYEGDIDWSEIIVDEDTSSASTASLSEESSSSTSESSTQDSETATSNLSETNSNSETNSDENTSDGETVSEKSDTNSNASETDEENSNTSSASEENSDDETNATSLEDETSEIGTSEGAIAGSNDETETFDNEAGETESETTDETDDDSAINDSKDIEETNENSNSSTLESEATATSEEGIATASDGDYYLSEYYSEETASNIWDLQCSTNQWVWISVDEDELEKIYGVDENGKYWGKTYYNYSENTGWEEINGKMIVTEKHMEPSVLTDYDTDSFLTSYLNGITTYELLTKELEEIYYETIESIKKYGGFYIGRYETGDLSEDNASVTKANLDIDSQNWYVMYEKCKGLAGKNTNVTTSMTWGSLWDATLRWLADSKATNSDGDLLYDEDGDIDYIWGDSTIWGNYSGATFNYFTSFNTTLIKDNEVATVVSTGSTEYTKVSNIYDLAGNICEWTLEGTYTSDRTCRGRKLLIGGQAENYCNAGYRGSEVPDNHGNSYTVGLGCRAILILN